MLIILGIVTVILILIIVKLNGKYNEVYWKKRGVKFYEKNKVIGPFWEFLISNRSFFEIFRDIYNQYPEEPAIGIGSLMTPAIYVKDLKNVNYVMQGSMFTDRGFIYNSGDHLADNILFMNGIRWKLMRQKMSPLFTSAKLKNMYYIIDKSAQDFVDYLNNNPGKLRGNTFDTLNRFCCNAIGAAVFGVGNEQKYTSPFLKLTRQAFFPSVRSNIRYAISHISPSLFKVLNLKYFNQFESFFFGAMKQVFRLREEEGVKKHDFADICLSLQRSGVMTHEDTGYQIKPTDEVLAAQGFFFFVAGVEPVATAIFGALIEIGRHPDVQRRLLDEIDEVFNLVPYGQISFDAINEMHYLDKVLNESMRLFPPIGYLTRKCTEDTTLPVGNIKIQKGTKIYTPLYELHHDPKFFEDPEVFNPERFSGDARQAMGAAYQPFGYGHRICIGMRYARLQVKSALAHLLRNYNVQTHVGKAGVQFGKDQVQLRMKNVEIEFIPRNKTSV